MQIRERFRNKLWVMGVISFITLLAKTYNLFEIPADFDVLVDLFLGILTGAGILIEPTSPGFKDRIDM